jgi:hypothetical protein
MGRCVVQTGLSRFAGCVLALSLVAGLVSCSEPDTQPSIAVTPVASSSATSRTPSPTPSADEQNLREAERAVFQFWRYRSQVGGPRLRSDRAHDGFARYGGGQLARKINQYRFDGVKGRGSARA